MSNDPETGGDEASSKTVKGPEGKAGEGIEGGRGKGDVFRIEERFDISGSLINDTDEEDIPETVSGASDAVMCTTCNERTSSHIRRGAECQTLVAACSERGMGVSGRESASNKRKN